MRNDPDHRKNKTAAQDKWLEANPDYWRNYRQRNPKYRERNRFLQKARDAKRRSRCLAKMDALEDKNAMKPESYYYIVPAVTDLAKMDALTQEFILIPARCEDCAKSCKDGLNGQPDSNCLRCPKKQTNDDEKAAFSGTHPHQLFKTHHCSFSITHGSQVCITTLTICFYCVAQKTIAITPITY